MRNRLDCIDVAKGLLMLMVIGIHLMSVGSTYGLNDCVHRFIGEYHLYLAAFYMPAFFVITGYCSDFSVGFSSFSIKNLKSLFLPSFIFPLIIAAIKMLVTRDSLAFMNEIKELILCGGTWFLTAMFFAKLIYYGIFNYFDDSKTQLALCLLINYVANLAYHLNWIPNIWYIYHAMELMLFIHLGKMIKHEVFTRQTIIYLSILYIITISVIRYLGDSVPAMHIGFSVSMTNYPLHLLLSITGSIVFLEICKLIGHSSILQFIGRNSLSYYVFDWQISTLLFFFFVPFISRESNFIIVITLYIVIFVANLLINAIIANSINTKCLKWALGKF